MLSSAFCLAVNLTLSQFATAARPSDTFLPPSTRGFVSIAHFASFEKKVGQTEFGQLVNDPSMEWFVKNFSAQLKSEVSIFRDKLGFNLDDLQGISEGEVSLALIDRPNQEAVIAIVIDTTGHKDQAKELMKKVTETFAARGAKKQELTIDTDKLLVFEVPDGTGETSQQTVYFQKDGMLCGIDDQSEAVAMLKRFSKSGTPALRSVPTYVTTMKRCQQAAGKLAPELRWFVNPFAFLSALRTLEREPLALDRDIVAILRDNGFDAIQGIGGYVNLLVKPHLEVIHRSFVYAPPVTGKEGDPLRWNLSMQMLQLHNTKNLTPESWVPRRCANYTTVNLDIANAFNHVAPIFDAIAGYDDAFETTMEGYENDPYGPQVNIHDEFVSYLGNRFSTITDYLTPITPHSEQFIYAIEASDPAALSKTLDKIMENDPDAKQRELGSVKIWEVIEPQYDLDDLELDAPALDPLDVDDFGSASKEEGNVLPNSGICVAEGYLIIASDVNYIREILAANERSERLIQSGAYARVERTMNELAPGPRCGFSFARLDESIRPDYELIRAGKMPESETTVGRLLNELLTTEIEEQEGILRRQRIDGEKLPSFEMVRRYFGMAGRVIRSEEDGWMITGAILNKYGP